MKIVVNKCTIYRLSISLPRNSRYFVQISFLLAYHDDDILSTMTQNCIGKKEQLTLLGAIYPFFCWNAFTSLDKAWWSMIREVESTDDVTLYNLCLVLRCIVLYSKYLLQYSESQKQIKYILRLDSFEILPWLANTLCHDSVHCTGCSIQFFGERNGPIAAQS